MYTQSFYHGLPLAWWAHTRSSAVSTRTRSSSSSRHRDVTINGWSYVGLAIAIGAGALPNDLVQCKQHIRRHAQYMAGVVS